MRLLDLNDPKSRALWLQVQRGSPELRHKMRELNALAFGNDINFIRDIPPHMNPERMRNLQNNNMREQMPQKQCFGCGKLGHTMGRCEKIQDLANKGVIRRSPAGRWMWKDGAPIVPKDAKTIGDAIDRGMKQAAFVRAERRPMNKRDEVESEEETDEEDALGSALLGW